MKEFKVLKIGGGVLGKIENFLENFPKIQDLILREKETCKKLVVVFSAFEGVTRELSNRAIFKDKIPMNSLKYARIVSEGEEEAVRKIFNMFSSQSDKYKITSIGKKNVPIITNSNYDNAEFKRVNIEDIFELFETFDIIFMPGFVAKNDRNQTTLLGNDGSDTSAILISIALRCDCIIIKDTGAIFTADPKVIPSAIRIGEMNPSSANMLASHGSNIIHSKGMAYAEMAGIRIIIRSVDGSTETIISKNVKINNFEGITYKKVDNNSDDIRLSVVGCINDPNIAYDILKETGYHVKKSENSFKKRASSIMLEITPYLPTEEELEERYNNGEKHDDIIRTVENKILPEAMKVLHNYFVNL